MSALRRNRGYGRSGSQGFTLLEVLLAFVVFALSFAAVLEIMAGSMRSVRRANDDTEVALLAQSLMAQVGTEIALEQGAYTGSAVDGYEWQLEIYPYEPADGDAYTLELAELSGIELLAVDLYIDWQAGTRQRSLRFSTIRSTMANNQ